METELENCALAIKRAKGQIVERIFEIGEILKKAHRLFANRGNGQYEQWVENECGFTSACARNYLRVVEAFRVKDPKSLFGTVTAEGLYYLARDATPEAARKDAVRRAKRGEYITFTTAKAIVAKHSVKEDNESESSTPEEALTDAPIGGKAAEDVVEEVEWESVQSAESAAPVQEQADPQTDDLPCPPASFIEALRALVHEWTITCPQDELPEYARVLRELADEVESGPIDLES